MTKLTTAKANGLVVSIEHKRERGRKYVYGHMNPLRQRLFNDTKATRPRAFRRREAVTVEQTCMCTGIRPILQSRHDPVFRAVHIRHSIAYGYLCWHHRLLVTTKFTNDQDYLTYCAVVYGMPLHGLPSLFGHPVGSPSDPPTA